MISSAESRGPDWYGIAGGAMLHAARKQRAKVFTTKGLFSITNRNQDSIQKLQRKADFV
jgi:hypothetical protein